MSLVSLRQLLDHAAEHGYGMPAFNVNNMEQVQAIMQAADETHGASKHAAFEHGAAKNEAATSDDEDVNKP